MTTLGGVAPLLACSPKRGLSRSSLPLVALRGVYIYIIFYNYYLFISIFFIALRAPFSYFIVSLFVSYN